MAESRPAKTCAVCHRDFVPKIRDPRRAKYCSKKCQREALKGVPTGGKAEATCQNPICGKVFSYYPSQGPGKYCSRACKNAHWKTPSADRGFEDLTKLPPFGRWTVLSLNRREGQHLLWNVRCSCPAQTESVVPGGALKSGASRSCGCIQREGQPRPEMKTCTICRRELPFTDEFFAWGGDGFRWALRPQCIECHRPVMRRRHLRWRRKIKREVLTHYAHGAPRCECCNEQHIEFLTLDHVNEDGSEDRRKRGCGISFYALLKREGYPNDPPLSVLCFNCNIARSMFGKCPHKRD